MLRTPWTWAACALALAFAVQCGSWVAYRLSGAHPVDAAEVRRLAPRLGGRVAWLTVEADPRAKALGALRAELPPRWREAGGNVPDLRRLVLFIDGQPVPIAVGAPADDDTMPQAFVRSPRAGAVMLRFPRSPPAEVLAVRPDAWLTLVVQMSRLAAVPFAALCVALAAGLGGVFVWQGTRRCPAWSAAVATAGAALVTTAWFTVELHASRWAAVLLAAQMSAAAVLAVRSGVFRRSIRLPRWATRLTLVAATVAFATVAVSRAVQDGVCCADDAVFAVAAKDLARGYGYPQGGGHHDEQAYFRLSDAYITVGPVVVLPAAAAIALLGNRHWVPGVATIAVWVALFIAIVIALRPFGDTRRRDLAMALFLFLCFALSAWHFEHWHALLGEVPASLLVWLAVAVWARRPRDRANVALASVLLGLACMTKLVAALCVPPFLASVALAGGVRVRTRWRRAGRNVAASLLAILLPVVVFQGYRAATAGPRVYVEEVRRWVDLTLTHAGRQPDAPGLLARVAATSRSTYDRFGVGPIELLLLPAIALFIVARRARPHLQLQVMVLSACVLTYLGWWLLVSRGWPRYLLIGLYLVLASAVLPLFALRRARHAVAYCAFLLACTAPNWERLSVPLRHGSSGWFAPSTETRNALAVAARLDAVPPDVPLYGQWWATVADLEYLSANVGRFSRLRDRSSFPPTATYAIALNTKFQWRPDPEFERMLSECRRDEAAHDPYAVFWCGRAGEDLPRNDAAPGRLSTGEAGRGHEPRR